MGSIATGGALALAGCGGGGGDSGQTTTDERTTARTTTDEQSTAAPTTEPPATTSEVSTTVGGPPSADVTITIENNAFDPVVASAPANAHVKWVNEDDTEHVVESTQFNDGAESWSSFARLDAGHSASFVIQGEGVHEYYCTIHGETTMCGAVLVGDVSQAGPLPCQEGE